MSTKASLGVKRSRGYSVYRALQGPIDTENPEAKDPWPDTHQLEGGYAPRQTQVPLGAAASASSPPHAHPPVTLPPSFTMATTNARRHCHDLPKNPTLALPLPD